MLTHPKILGKLNGIRERYEALRFETVASVPVELWETKDHLRAEPGSDVPWRAVAEGEEWGGDWVTGWFRGDVTLPEACEGRKAFVHSRIGAESLFWVNGATRGVFDHFHPLVCAMLEGKAGTKLHVAFESYSGHVFPGTQPFETGVTGKDVVRRFGGVELALEREDVSAFVRELTALCQLVEALDGNSLRKHRIARALQEVFSLVDAAPGEGPEASWRPKLAEARTAMAPLLALRNGPSTPHMATIGASHIDTAWLWPISETWRKCARTFSSVLNLMEQYPEMLFLQPAPYHAEIVRQEYPELFERMRAQVKTGRWEPNGGMWIEPDCNIPSGESFVRQVLEAQRWTREHFGYRGDTLWLPDVFGYSAALPQILRQGGIEFFITTKMDWNDTTRFPYDSFHWKGIDGSSVLANLNLHDTWTDPRSLIGAWNWVQHKDVDDRRLIAYGHGDGGGGPRAEMLEMGRVCADLEGCPTLGHETISSFMRGLRDDIPHLPEWSGELYLELHRGTLTSIAGIKRGNRKAEFALRDAELLATLARLDGAAYPAEELRALWRELLVDQFHDILPGSSIAEVNDEAIESFRSIVEKAEAISRHAVEHLAGPTSAEPTHLLVVNTLSWDRSGEFALAGVPAGLSPADADLTYQWVTDVLEQPKLVVEGTVPAFSGVLLEVKPSEEKANDTSSFSWDGEVLDSPCVTARFDAAGRIVSLLDKQSGREVVRPGGALNTMLVGEDIPRAWDNWDIDSDQELKMLPEERLTSQEAVADGPLQFRIRQVRPLGKASTVTQHVVFHAESPRIDFETVIDWHEKRTLLKAAFDLNVLADMARHEIQYGHVERPTHRNLPQDRARFEVCAHKWTDLGDNAFGVALLNDCKYGVSVAGSSLGLSLVKAGAHPDPRGDEGRHLVTYSLLPHVDGFSVDEVVRPAYELNVQPLCYTVGADAKQFEAPFELTSVDAIIEAVKWADDGDGVVLRAYDAGRSGAASLLALEDSVTAVSTADILEEREEPLTIQDGVVGLYFRPFEIKTLRLRS